MPLFMPTHSPCNVGPTLPHPTTPDGNRRMFRQNPWQLLSTNITSTPLYITTTHYPILPQPTTLPHPTPPYITSPHPHLSPPYITTTHYPILPQPTTLYYHHPLPYITTTHYPILPQHTTLYYHQPLLYITPPLYPRWKLTTVPT